MTSISWRARSAAVSSFCELQADGRVLNRSDWRDQAAAELAATYLERTGGGGPVLVMEDSLPLLPGRLRATGVEVVSWWRRAFAGRAASPWPPAGPFRVAALRLPRAKEELDMLLHAAAGRLDPSGVLVVYGAKDEGAASVLRRMERFFEDVETVAVGGRCRVIRASSPSVPPELGEGLAPWRVTFALGVPELPERWVSYPGVFAHGRLDGGTALLLRHLPAIPAGARVLDFGCGHGVVGAVVLARTASAEVDFIDVDTVALEAGRENVPGARFSTSDGWGGIGTWRYDFVLSNPPYHRGKGESLRAIQDLIGGCAKHLEGRGCLALVVQRRLPVGPLLDEAFGSVAVLADEGPWRVWSARDRTTRE